MRLPFQLAIYPPDFMTPTYTPKGNLVLCTKLPFFRNKSSLFLFGCGSFLVLPSAAPAGVRRGQYGASVGSGRTPWPILYVVKVTWPSKQLLG